MDKIQQIDTTTIKNPISASTQQQFDDLQKQFQALKDEFYRNNFTSHQEFAKTSRFSNTLIVPHYDTLPATVEKGSIGEFNGKLYIASATDVWTIVGSQS